MIISSYYLYTFRFDSWCLSRASLIPNMREKPRHYTFELSSRLSLKIINSLIIFVQMPSLEDQFPIGSSSELAFEGGSTESLLVTTLKIPVLEVITQPTGVII